MDGLGKEPLASPVTCCPLISSHQTASLCGLGFFFFVSIIWHPWKLVFYYRFPAFISLHYKISWEEESYELPGTGAEAISETREATLTRWSVWFTDALHLGFVSQRDVT